MCDGLFKIVRIGNTTTTKRIFFSVRERERERGERERVCVCVCG